jgi:hypothetical protein
VSSRSDLQASLKWKISSLNLKSTFIDATLALWSCLPFTLWADGASYKVTCFPSSSRPGPGAPASGRQLSAEGCERTASAIGWPRAAAQGAVALALRATRAETRKWQLACTRRWRIACARGVVCCQGISKSETTLVPQTSTRETVSGHWIVADRKIPDTWIITAGKPYWNWGRFTLVPKKKWWSRGDEAYIPSTTIVKIWLELRSDSAIIGKGCSRSQCWFMQV